MSGPSAVFDLRPTRWSPADGALEDLCRRAIDSATQALQPLDLSGWEVGVTITDDMEIRALNRDHLGRDKATNVLSFPLDGPNRGTSPSPGGLLGDIVLSDETLLREAARESRAPAEHLIHLVIHGMLHLMGYDHVASSDAVKMETLEIKILADLGIANPYSTSHAPKSRARETLKPSRTRHA
ncbi:MAG: rRNA maturation RNase YbeY [Rhodospirillaceae bacterium]|nr:rRNA maturation RNase YbeY [Rhodospirillaceae bacterium]